MKATGKIEKTAHMEDCEAVKTATRGRGTPAQRSPWFNNGTTWGDRSGPSRGGAFSWLEFRCRGNGCEGLLLLRTDYVMARVGMGKFSA